MADHWTGSSEPESPGETALRAALVPTLRILAPILLLTALAWSRVDRPSARLAALTLLASAVVLGALALRWRARPPRSAHGAAAAAIGLIHLCSMAQLIAFPDPALISLYLITALGTAFLLVDLRWMLAVQLFGALTWVAAIRLAPPPTDWSAQAYVLAAGIAGAIAFRAGRMGSLHKVRTLSLLAEERARAAETAEAERRLEEDRLRRAQRLASVGSYEWTLATGELHWSEQHYRIFGWDPDGEPVTNERFFEAIHPDDRQAIVEAVAASIQHGEAVDLAFRILRPDGEQRIVHGRGETLFDADGRASTHVGTTLDITDMQRTRKALWESTQYTGAILNALDLHRAVVIERDGTLESLLGVAEGTGRYGPIRGEEIPGLTIDHFLPGEPGERVLAAVRRVYDTGERAELEEDVAFPTGVFHFDVSLRPVFDDGQRVASVLALVRDVSERKAQEQARQEARRLESIGALAGGIAHDFNNLLVGIMGNTEAALEEAEASLSPQLDGILQASERAAALTRQLLAYAGEASTSRERLDLRALVEDMIGLVRAAVSGRAAVELDGGPEPVWIEADASQIREIVMSLVTNASEALGDGHGHIGIRVGATSLTAADLDACAFRDDVAEGEYAVLEVTDDGIGMDAETRSRIFDPFFTTKFAGRGLGLAAVLGMIRSHGGAIQVESEPGRATTLRAFFPRTEARAAAPPTQLPSRHPGAGRVLVVDDEKLVRGAAARMLRLQGFAVTEAASGFEAIELVRGDREAFDLALIDLTMPEMDGAQTLAELRRLRADLPAVLMTGHGPDASGPEEMGGPRSSLLRKPFRMGTLLQSLREALDPNADGSAR